eukprot:14172883-Ditylum_brightwellii.AAC.1
MQQHLSLFQALHLDKRHHFEQKGMDSSWFHTSYITSRNNKGVTTRANNKIECKHDYLYKRLEPDWDIISQSAEYMQGLGSKLKIEHVKFHQDYNYNVEQLDLPAQLNITADKLATNYR